MTVLVIVTVLALMSAAIVAALASSFRLPAERSAFSCKIRPAPVDGVRTRRWPKQRCRAVWVHDVLMIRSGRLRVWLRALPVRTPEDPVRATANREVQGLGVGPLAVVLRMDDG